MLRPCLPSNTSSKLCIPAVVARFVEHILDPPSLSGLLSGYPHERDAGLGNFGIYLGAGTIRSFVHMRLA
jgi:hypothetical protein